MGGLKILFASILQENEEDPYSKIIQDHLKATAKEIQFKTMNLADYLSPTVRKIILQGPDALKRFVPKLWGFLYSSDDISQIFSPFVDLKSHFQYDSITGLVKDYQPDLIVSTHPYCSIPIGKLIEDKAIDAILISWILDFHIHKLWIQGPSDFFFVPNQALKRRLQQFGVNDEKIMVAGLPVEAPVLNMTEIRQQLKLNAEGFYILFLTEGLDEDLIEKAMFQFSLVKRPCELLISTGNREDVSKMLRKKALDYGIKAKMFSKAPDLSQFIALSNIIICQPDEAMLSRIVNQNRPAIFIKPKPGPQEENCRFLEEEKGAFLLENVGTLAEKLERLGEPALHQQMTENLKGLIDSAAFQKIAEVFQKISGQAGLIKSKSGRYAVPEAGPRPEKKREEGLFEEIGDMTPVEAGSSEKRMSQSQYSRMSPPQLHAILTQLILREKDLFKTYEAKSEQLEKWKGRLNLAMQAHEEDLIKSSEQKIAGLAKELLQIKEEITQIKNEKEAMRSNIPKKESGQDKDEDEMERRFREMEIDDRLRALKLKLSFDE